MFVKRLKKVLIDAMTATFDSQYVEPDFRDIPVYLRYPVAKSDYPGIWVDYENASDLQKGGIDHSYYDVDDVNDVAGRYSKWRFQGWVTFTGVTLNNMERDRLFDEVVRIMAFGEQHAATSDFRKIIEANDYLAVNFDFDEIGVRGFSSTPGTPWGTNDVVSEFTVAMECIGEFFADVVTRDLIRLSDMHSALLRVGPAGVEGPVFSEPDEEQDIAGGWQ